MNFVIDEKLKRLKDEIRNMKKVVVAYSGGLDSTFLLKVAYDTLKNNAIAVTIDSPLQIRREIEYAKEFTENNRIRHIIIKFHEDEIKKVLENKKDRCYHCKRIVFSKIRKIAKENDIDFVIEGSNTDDLLDYRPGMRALKELSIISPLIDNGFSKQDIRELSKKIGLETWDKYPSPCLATRFPYGIRIEKSKLKKVEKAESFINSLGIKQIRVRIHNDIARIEVEKDDFEEIIKNSDKIIMYFKKLGFRYTTLDLEGYRRGSLNEGVIDDKKIVVRLQGR